MIRTVSVKAEFYCRNQSCLKHNVQWKEIEVDDATTLNTRTSRVIEVECDNPNCRMKNQVRVNG